MRFDRTISLLFLAAVETWFLGGALAQVDILSARLELVELKRHFREESDLQAARGGEFGLLDFEVEFENASDLGQVSLETPQSPLLGLERDGNFFRFEDFVGQISGGFLGTYTIVAGLQAGGSMEFEFAIEDFEVTEFPQIAFPTDGADELDAEDLEADWDASGNDSNRIDLFEIGTAISNVPSDLGNRLQVWRTTSEGQDLEPELFPNRTYEIWIGSTEFMDAAAEFDVEFWYTSSLYARFTTGPNPREDISGFNFNEYVTSLTAGIERKRFGQTSPPAIERTVARLVGNAIEGVEVGRVQGPMDARLVDSIPLQSMNTVENDTVFEREVTATAGQSVLFLMEFRITALVGSEIAQVDASLPFPQILAPLSNEAGLGSTIQVTWNGVAGADSYEISLRQLSGGFTSHSGPLSQSARNHTFTGVPSNADFELEVAAKSNEGSVSKTSILVSRRPPGDANGDGSATGTDAFGFASRWMSRVPIEEDFVATSRAQLLDLDGDEALGANDVILFLDISRISR